jgi:8-oxo-dGTP pyrophosphatase MutT (NUDIX family)
MDAAGADVTTVLAALAHPRIARIAGALAERPGAVLPEDGIARHAAVALILRLADDGDAELLMIKRAAYPGDPWSGHIALPGGRREPADASLEQTAIRETFEETAIDLASIGRLVGTLDEVRPRTPRLPPLIIRPFVFIAPRDVTIIPSREVAEVFWVPLPMLAHPSATGEATFTDRGTERTERSFRLGQHVVWGLTERILRQFIDYACDAPSGGASRAG